MKGKDKIIAKIIADENKRENNKKRRFYHYLLILGFNVPILLLLAVLLAGFIKDVYSETHSLALLLSPLILLIPVALIWKISEINSRNQ